jgi:predicted DNA-binding protein
VIALGRIKLGTRVGFYLSGLQIKRLKKLSDKTSISVSEHIRRAVDEYLERFERKGKRR